MPRTLVLMRHAKSDWSGDQPDLDRPIGKRGRRQAAEAGRWLNENLRGLDLVITSPATRARQTWDCVRGEYGDRPPQASDERFYTLDDAGMLAVLREVDDAVGSLLLVGHNPGMDELVARLTGERVDMVTSALAVTRFEGPWAGLVDGSCELVAHGRPPVG